MAVASPRRRRALAGATGAVLLVALTGCGSEPTTLGESARTTLHHDVDKIRDAADDPAKAQAALAAFRGHIDDLVAQDALDPADALALVAHAARIENRVDAAPSPSPSPSPEATARTASAPKAEARPATVIRTYVAPPTTWKQVDKKGNGKSKGAGKGKKGHDK